VASKTSVTVGTKITLNCNYWEPKEKIRFYWDKTTNTSFASVVVGSNGTAKLDVTIPALTGGAHDLIGKGSKKGKTSTNAMTIKASLLLSPKSGTVNTRVTVTFQGYRSGESITLVWYVDSKTTKKLKQDLKAGKDGTIKYTFKVPSGGAAGTHKVEGQGNQKSKASANFTQSGTSSASIEEPRATKTPKPAPTRRPTAVSPEPTPIPTFPPMPTIAPTPTPEE
jgi:hypothetical protein